MKNLTLFAVLALGIAAAGCGDSAPDPSKVQDAAVPTSGSSTGQRPGTPGGPPPAAPGTQPAEMPSEGSRPGG